MQRRSGSMGEGDEQRIVTYVECTRLFIERKIFKIEVTWNRQKRRIGKFQGAVGLHVDEMIVFVISSGTSERIAYRQISHAGTSIAA
jgi:hypothetical protein